jgi:beta-mannosidase
MSPIGRRLELDGEWAFREDPEGIGELYPAELAYTHADEARWMSPLADLRAWSTTSVPGPWPIPSGREGTVWFRREFPFEPDGDPQARTMLEFEGINYLGDVWLNDRFLGTHEGYFAPLSFDVTDLLGPANVLVVRVASADDVLGKGDQMGQLKRDFVGALGRWDMNDPERKPAGIWGAVRLAVVGPIRVENLRIDAEFTRSVDLRDRDAPIPAEGVLSFDLVAVGAARAVSIDWAVSAVGFDEEPQTGRVTGIRSVRGRRATSVDLDLRVRPWWTWDLGEPRLYDVRIEVRSGADLLETRTLRTGFRSISCDRDWDLRLNGVPLYQRGANYLSDIDMSSMTAERYARDLDLVRAANLNTVHTFCHVERSAFYAGCDERGLIVYQDFPAWLMVDTSSETVRRATAQVDDMVGLLRRHPSVAIWNLGSQPSIANMDKLCLALADRCRELDPSRIAQLGNAAVSYEAVDDVHPTRSFFWERSEAERFEQHYGWRRDNHLYPGWYFGGLDAIRALPSSDFVLVSEFGAQSLPDLPILEEFLVPGDSIDWVAIAHRCGQPWLLQRHNPEAHTLTELIEHSQRHQAELVRHHTEYIRSLKGRPGRGLHLFAFTDCWPAVSWSVVDYSRTPKPAYFALARAMEPVQVFLAEPGAARAPGRRELLLAVVNDGPAPIADARMTILVGGAVQREIPIDGIPNDVALDVAATVSFDIPGETDLRVALSWDGGQVVNEYRVVVAGQDASADRGAAGAASLQEPMRRS